MTPTGVALSVLRRFARSGAADRLNLREPAQRVLRRTMRDSARAAGAIGKFRKSSALQRLTQPVRLQRPAPPDRFDIRPSDEQEMIRDTAQRFALERLRGAAPDADESCRMPAGTREQLGELGLTPYAVPESLGGAGAERSPVTQALIAEALAFGDMGLALCALAPMGVATALSMWGDAEQQGTYLPAFVEDAPPPATLAMMEPGPLFDPFALCARARRTRGGFVLEGEKTLVPLATEAELFLVTARLGDEGPQTFLLERDAPGLRPRSEPTMGLRASGLGTLQLDGVQVRKEALLGGEVGASNYEQLVDLARIGWCALAVGTSQAVLDYVIDYCNDRVAFGEPVSHRQGVAFPIANIGIELESMRLLTYRAASRAEQGQDFHRETYLARTLCAEKAMQIGSDGVQMLGGHGFVKDHPMERWYRDLRSIGVMEGGLLV